MRRYVLFVFLVFVSMLVFSACSSTSTQGVNEDPSLSEQTDPNVANKENDSNNDSSAKGEEEDSSNEEGNEDGQQVEEETPSQSGQNAEEAPSSGENEKSDVAKNTSPYKFEYPDGVRGIYVTGHSAGGSRFNKLLELVNTTELNAMVIDIKDDYGYITFRPNKDSSYYPYSKNYIKDIQQLLKTLEENKVYPIARIVVFKDSVITKDHPEWSFLENGQIWRNRNKDSFVNPFVKDVWEYNVGVAKLAAEAGFKEIQFDYVRFPEGFEKRDSTLTYSMGDYQAIEGVDANGAKTVDMVQPRVHAVTDFVAYAKQELSDYDVDISVDIFGYAATIKEAPGIGQNFTMISENVDVISSMIYPSHWTPYFGIQKPDTEPYRLVQEYAKVEKEKLSQLQAPPVSRPWIQDFTATWLGKGNYIKYGKQEVEAQIRALHEAGIWEFLIWNANNNYSPGVNYLPVGKKPE